MSEIVAKKNTFEIPKCNECIHLKDEGKCLAFPDGIPVEILNNNKFHDKIITGQVGKYVFEKK